MIPRAIVLIVFAILVLVSAILLWKENEPPQSPRKVGDQTQGDVNGEGGAVEPPPRLDGVADPLENVPVTATTEDSEQAAPSRGIPGTFSGQILDVNGDPVEGVEIHAFEVGLRGIGGRIVAQVFSDASGLFVLHVPPQKDDLQLGILCEGFISHRMEYEDGSTATIRLKPDPAFQDTPGN